MKTRMAALAGFAALLIMSGPALADSMKILVELNGAMEVPPTDSAATGSADIQVDTAAKKITWEITHTGLSGNPTAAHFHGPAAIGQNAGPLIDISGKLEKGEADLTDSQLADLQAGKLYLNIHTAKFPNGEIRGQVAVK